jgi:hypothetical protein
MSLRKRRGPVLGNRPSHDSTTTTALDGLSLSLSKHWIRHQEDQCGDFWELSDTALVLPAPGPTRKGAGCGCAGWYTVAA